MVLLWVAVVASRAPLLLHGYGADPDAWRVAYVARELWTFGRYEVSRLPGYPLYEFISSLPIALGGSFCSNVSTLLCALVVILVWSRISHTYTRSPRLLVPALAFAPLFWVNSAATMDYVWSLLFILIGYGESLGGRSIRSGLSMGIAVGFRPSNAVVAAAIIVVLLLHDYPWLRITRFLIAFALSALIAFLPVVHSYGLKQWLQDTFVQSTSYHESAAMQILLFGYRAVYSIGPLAFMAAVLTLGYNAPKVCEYFRKRDVILLSSAVGITAILLLFLLFPNERGYLLPLIPFLLLLLEKVGSRKALIASILCILSFAFLNPDVIRHAGMHGTLGLNLRPGMVIEEVLRKQALLNRRAFLSTYPYQENTVVMTGTGPAFWLENPLVEPLQTQSANDKRDIVVRSISKRQVLFTPMLDKNSLDSVRAMGYSVLCASDVLAYVEKSTGYSMASERIGLVNVPAF